MTDISPATLSPRLRQLAATRLADFCERHPEQGVWLIGRRQSSEDFSRQLDLVWSTSRFIYETCRDWPAVLRELVDSGDLFTAYDDSGLIDRLVQHLEGVNDEPGLHRVLRQFRRREMLRIVWRDFTRQAPLLETTGDVTRLAEASIQQALAVLHPLVEQQMGEPIGEFSGAPQRMVVLGMGKMGAWELNVSSDIDLIFAYPESGYTEGGKKPYSNQEFFLRLAQKLIQAIDKHTVDGFVFRVDMRLRPYGESGALVLGFDAMENYYQTQGRDWERYAMIKARAVAGEPQDCDRLTAILRPFTYRKYIDFSAIQSLRDMKALINREVLRLGIVDDVKKGAGGIREVEFIAQAFQLIRGGKDKRFQNPSLQRVLGLLDEGLLPEGEAAKLWDAYVFLRNVEHVLQGMADKQTQALPVGDDERESVAVVMGFADWSAFYGELQRHRTLVQAVFAGIAAEGPGEQTQLPLNTQARNLWLAVADAAAMAGELAAMGFAETDGLARQLINLRQSRAVAGLSATARARLDDFMPLLLTLSLENPAHSHLAVGRILPLVEAVLRRSAYLVLMLENHGALRQLVRLCSESSWIAEQVKRYPALLDELLDPRALFTPQDKDAIRQDMRQYMLRVPSDDLEAQMEVLRYFRRAQALRIAACEVAGVLPLMKVSDNLTWLAEVILDQVQAIAWDWMTARHGFPGRASVDQPMPGMAVIGYGKLGGLELGPSSDLDLVFIHNADPNRYTDGERSIDNNTFFMRLCQRMIHILSTQTPSGDIYEVDARLRPNGNSGMLVITLAAFEDYQRSSAWTWEHQALVRARPVAGDSAIAEGFNQVRHAILALPRDVDKLRAEVVDMREKMRAHLGSKAAEREHKFHLKQDPGGIVDIEFLVQYHALRHGGEHADLLEFTDNMRILDAIGRNRLLPEDDVKALQQAYVYYRSLGHRLSLQGAPSVVELAGNEELAGYRQQVVGIWVRCFLG